MRSFLHKCRPFFLYQVGLNDLFCCPQRTGDLRDDVQRLSRRRSLLAPAECLFSASSEDSFINPLFSCGAGSTVRSGAHSCQTGQDGESKHFEKDRVEEESITFSWRSEDQTLRDMSSNTGRGKYTTQARPSTSQTLLLLLEEQFENVSCHFLSVTGCRIKRPY